MPDVYPQPNVPPESVMWARRLESSNRTTERGVSDIGKSLRGANSATAGQSAVMGRTINSVQATVSELASRNTAVQTLASITTTRTTPTLNTSYAYDTSTSVTFPSPDGQARSGVIFVSFSGSNSHPTITSGTLFLSAGLTGANQNLYSEVLSNPSAASTPSGWTDASFISGGFVSSNLTVTLRATGYVSRYAGSATTLTIGAQDVRVVVVWGGV